MVLGVALAAVLCIDQVTKVLVRSSMHPSESVPVIEGVFHLTYVRNTGAAFGLMPGQQALFIVTTILVLAGIGLYWWRTRPRSLVLALALGMVAGGAIGNVIDRVAAGRVTDFLDVLTFPVFNVADIGIVIGAAGLFIWAVFAPVDEIRAVSGDTTHEPSGGPTIADAGISPEGDPAAPEPEE